MGYVRRNYSHNTCTADIVCEGRYGMAEYNVMLNFVIGVVSQKGLPVHIPGFSRRLKTSTGGFPIVESVSIELTCFT